jgi:alcohol dehydrogenase class IV
LLGYGEEDIPALVDGALKQQRLLVIAPKQVDRSDIEAIFRQSMRNS